MTGAPDTRTPAAVGRSARLELSFERRRGRTMLVHAYAEPPFRVGRTFEDGDGVRMILATVAPGIFGGDRLRQTIHVGSGARVQLVSQSALQIHPSSAGDPASIRSQYAIDDAGELRGLWDPAIPFAGARLDQRIDIQLTGRGRVLWSDATMAGREGHGERWAFNELSHQLIVSRDRALEYVERYHIVPAVDRLARMWSAGSACYFGTVFASGWPVAEELTRDLHAALSAIADLRAAADRLGDSVVLVRLMAAAGIQFRDARQLVSTLLDRAQLQARMLKIGAQFDF